MSDDVDPKQLIGEMSVIWAETLAVPIVVGNANFFNLGGDSMKAAELMIRIEERYDITLDTVEIFDHPELEEFSSFVSGVISSYRESCEEVVL